VWACLGVRLRLRREDQYDGGYLARAASVYAGRVARSLRIAEFTDNYGPGRSGILYAVQQIEGALLEAGHEVIVVAPKASGPNPYAHHPRRTEVRLPSVRVPGVPARVASGAYAEPLVAKVGDLRPDVIHVHGLGLVGLMGVALARRTGIPLVVTWHTDWDAYAEHYALLTPVLAAAYHAWRVRAGSGALDQSRARASARAFRQAGRQRMAADLLGACTAMLTAATVVTTPSPKTAKRVLAAAPEVDVRAIPNGVDPLPLAGPSPVPPSPGVRFTYVGRIAPEKGIGLLLDAYKIVRKSVPGTELMIVGDWKKVPTLRARLLRARRHPEIRLVGEVDRSNLGPYYAASDVFVFPSLTDTQALVLHEAAHAGLPLVVCDRELGLVLHDKVNGEFCDPTPDALAGAMLRLMDRVRDPVTRAKAAEVSRELAARYTVAGQDQAILDLYAEVAGGGLRVPVARPRVPGRLARAWSRVSAMAR
jgi:1,2-diacylglycerol 3-alpha-glucosyltransferase